MYNEKASGKLPGSNKCKENVYTSSLKVILEKFSPCLLNVVLYLILRTGVGFLLVASHWCSEASDFGEF
jgi:hypothetical protein